MIAIETRIIGEKIILPQRFDDARGWFAETWNHAALVQAGIDLDFVHDNHSISPKAGTIRGLHYQAPPHAQDKLVRCSRGAIWDVAVDVRRGSPSYGQWVGVELSADNGRQFLVPKGCLHGFISREAYSEVQYKATDYYAPDCDGAVRWDSLGIDWGYAGAPVISDKDAAAPAFSDWESPFTWEGEA